MLLYNYETFHNNQGIRAVIIHFCFVLIDLINDYRNVYSRNNVCVMIFMRIVSMKRGYESIFRFVSMLF